jgi:cytochrome c
MGARAGERRPGDTQEDSVFQPTHALGLLLSVLSALTCTPALALDASAAEQILSDNKCTKCHAVDRKKDGPAYRDVAAKFRPEADAVPKLIHHMTAGERVKFPDGHEEKHKKIKAANEQEVKDLAQWILTLPGGQKY